MNLIPKLALGRKRVASKGFTVGGQSPVSRMAARLGKVYRQLVNFPDGQIGWYPFAVREGLRLATREKPSVIYSSCLPATSHLIASRIARETGIPWVAEFRDPWTDNPGHVRRGVLGALERQLEDRTMRNAVHMVTVTPTLVTQLGARFNRPVSLVTNGFDPEDYPTDVLPTREFTMTFTGMVYPDAHDIRPLCQALAQLRASGELIPGFRLRLAGRATDALFRQATESGMQDLVELIPQVSHAEALRLQMESTVLLLLLWKDPGAPAWYPAKMFEYFGSGRPILAVGAKVNDAAGLIAELGAGVAVDEVQETVQVLRQWFKKFQDGGPSALSVARGAAERFQRVRVVSELARVLDTVRSGAAV